MIVIMIRSLSLPGAMEGVKFLFDFSFDKLTWMSVLNAMGFTFFSLSLGCGIMVTYGAYLKDSTDIPNSSLWIAYLAIQTALLAGLMIMPAVFAMGQDPNAGPGLVFVTIPFIFSQIPFGWFFMILFNVCLLVAALTSSVSLLEVCIAYLQNEWHMKRISASILCYVGLALLGCVPRLVLLEHHDASGRPLDCTACRLESLEFDLRTGQSCEKVQCFGQLLYQVLAALSGSPVGTRCDRHGRLISTRNTKQRRSMRLSIGQSAALLLFLLNFLSLSRVCMSLTVLPTAKML